MEALAMDILGMGMIITAAVGAIIGLIVLTR